MKKIGFIDYYLDEWHANQYPAWIGENAAAHGRKLEVAFAWADIDHPNGGAGTDAWCARTGVARAASIEELIAKSDYLVVLSPDHPEHHERLGRLALEAGKPVYMDKTFAPDKAAGQRMFELAERHGTPLFSSSALRFSRELEAAAGHPPEAVEYMATMGPGQYGNYSIHQYEMIVSVMGLGAKRIKSHSTAGCRLLVIDYGDGRQATLQQIQSAPFQASMQLKSGEGLWLGECTEFFPRFIRAMLDFFETGRAPVPKEQTLEILALIEAGGAALKRGDTWVGVE